LAKSGTGNLTSILRFVKEKHFAFQQKTKKTEISWWQIGTLQDFLPAAGAKAPNQLEIFMDICETSLEKESRSTRSNYGNLH